MEVTEVKVTLVNSEDGKLKAFANIVLDGCFVVRGLKVIEGKQRTLVMMPSVKRKDGSHQDSAYPINRELHQHIEDEVLYEYAQKVASRVGGEEKPFYERSNG
jgi:stage V sporulation protein G